ncbi:MAG: DNA helicase II, partial [Alphaproteobacteria bacterium]
LSAERGLYGGGFAGKQAATRPRRGGRRNETAWAAAPTSGGDAGDLRIGQRVFHQKFGYGAIRHIDGDKLEIAFEKAGSKKVMAGFVEDV